MHTMCDVLVTVWQLTRRLFFDTAQDKYSVNNLLFLLSYHNGIVETLLFLENKMYHNFNALLINIYLSTVL